jgi:hypothetical protein
MARGTGRRHVTPLGGVVVGALLLLLGCQGSGFAYVQSPARDTFFKVPEGWELFDEQDLSGDSLKPSFDMFAGDGGPWTVAFDAAPDPSVDNVLDAASMHPAGYALVRQLTEDERDTYSLTSLRNEVIPIDRLAQTDGAIEEVSEEDISQNGGLRGARLVNNLKVGDEYYTIDQTGVLDKDGGKIFLLVIGCKAVCYEENRKVIEQVADSWTIKET